MNESQIDLAHAVALGSIGDEDRRAVRELLDTADETLRADFDREVQTTREALTVFASASAAPAPAALRDRLLTAIADEQSVTAPGAATARPDESNATTPR